MNRKCFAERDGGMCDATEIGVCTTYDCPFFATEAEHKAAIRRVYAHLRSLPQKQQDYISRKYYKGRKPWDKTGG